MIPMASLLAASAILVLPMLILLLLPLPVRMAMQLWPLGLLVPSGNLGHLAVFR